MQGNGIIIQVKKLNDKDAFIKIFTDCGNIVSGFFKYGLSKKNLQTCQISNLVKFSWIGRENSLGSISVQSIKSYSSLVILSKISTLSTASIINLLYTLLDDKYSYIVLYEKLLHFLNTLSNNLSNYGLILYEYIQLEIILLITTGYYKSDEIGKYKNYIFLNEIFVHHNKVIPRERNLLENIIIKYLENNNFDIKV